MGHGLERILLVIYAGVEAHLPPKRSGVGKPPKRSGVGSAGNRLTLKGASQRLDSGLAYTQSEFAQ